MNREEYLKKLKESVENGRVDEDLTSHHYAILNKAEEKAAKVKADLQKQQLSESNDGLPTNNLSRIDKIREEGRPSANDRIRLNANNGDLEHVEIENINNVFLTSDEKELRTYAKNINEILGEEKIVVKDGDISIKEKTITADQITKERVIKEITLLNEENQRCYTIIARNNDLLTYLHIELSTL